MGYSCTAIASEVEKALMGIIRDTDASNVFRGYFAERGRENTDGAITGTIWKFVGDNRAKRAGSYRISAEGKIVRFPGTTADERKLAEQTGKARFSQMYPDFATDENLLTLEDDEIDQRAEDESNYYAMISAGLHRW